MKRIGLISDTHGFTDEKMIKYLDGCDEIWHAGDIGSFEVVKTLSSIAEFKAVYGNIDSYEIRKVFKKTVQFKCEDVSVFMTHIGGYPGKYNSEIFPDLISHHPDLFISGHSHILKVMYDKKHDFLHMNPGAIGKYGLHKIRTILRFTVDKKNISDLEIIEIER